MKIPVLRIQTIFDRIRIRNTGKYGLDRQECDHWFQHACVANKDDLFYVLIAGVMVSESNLNQTTSLKEVSYPKHDHVHLTMKLFLIWEKIVLNFMLLHETVQTFWVSKTLAGFFTIILYDCPLNNWGKRIARKSFPIVILLKVQHYKSTVYKNITLDYIYLEINLKVILQMQ
jgi:hypothetical protein